DHLRVVTAGHCLHDYTAPLCEHPSTSLVPGMEWADLGRKLDSDPVHYGAPDYHDWGLIAITGPLAEPTDRLTTYAQSMPYWRLQGDPPNPADPLELPEKTILCLSGGTSGL